MYRRVAEHVAMAESKYGTSEAQVNERADKFYRAMKNGRSHSPKSVFLSISDFAKSILIRDCLDISCRFHNIGLNNLATPCNLRLAQPCFCHSDLSMA